jgi:hypothetical protein
MCATTSIFLRNDTYKIYAKKNMAQCETLQFTLSHFILYRLAVLFLCQ